jgi:hypothetical protein
MKKLFTVVVSVFFLVGAGSARAELLNYGSFEYGVAPPFTEYCHGQWLGGVVGSWLVTEADMCPGLGDTASYGINPPDGSAEFAHIGNWGQDDAIAQTFTTGVGRTYLLSFWMEDNNHDQVAYMDVQIKGVNTAAVYLSQTYSTTGWVKFTDIFTAGDTSCVITFDNQPGVGINLDVVSIIDGSIVITETGADTSVNEDGETSDTFSVVLSQLPTEDVTLTLDPDSEIRLNGASVGTAVDLVFTPTDWDTPQTVAVSAVDDQGGLAEIGEGVTTSTISMSATTGDSFYASLDYSQFDLAVEVIDASSRFYNGFTVSAATGQTPWQWEKATYATPGGVDFNADGTIEPAGSWMAPWVADVHKYGAKTLMTVGNLGFNNADFHDVVDNADGSRDTFVSALVAYIQNNGLDGINFDIEWSQQIPPWLNYNLCLVELRAALGSSYEIRCNVYGTRNEIKSNGYAAIDAVDIMSYQDFSEMTSFIGLQKSYGASDSQIHGGMATSWNEFGVDPVLAAQKTQYCLDNGYGGAFLFGFDTEEPATSMLLAVRDTIINHYYGTDGCGSPNPDFDGSGLVQMEDWAQLAARWLDAPCGNLNDCCDLTDLNLNGVVDSEDAAMLAGNWLWRYENLVRYPSFEYFGAGSTLHYYFLGEWLGGVADTWQVTKDASGWGIVLLPDGWSGNTPVVDGAWNGHIAEGGTDGAISQEIATVAGQSYDLSFWHEDFGNNELASMRVTLAHVGGSVYWSRDFTATNPTVQTATFTAASNNSLLTFDNLAFGNTIDIVSVTQSAP